VSALVEPRLIAPVRVVVNAGHGVAGAAFDAIASKLVQSGAEIEVVRLYHEPDGTFPAGIPNPLLPENRGDTADAVRATKADLGIAWDGDFDRCFFFDANGEFVPGEYIVGLLAESLLETSPGATIVHDPRVVLNTLEIVARAGGQAAVARTGHAHIKQAMRDTGAVYGGEMSAHHYFKDFMCCDSGMIPWIKVLELMGRTGRSLTDLVGDMARRHPSSGERNFTVANPSATIERIREIYAPKAKTIDELDGLSLTFPEWRMNLRPSSTEPLLRLNVESKSGRETLDVALAGILSIISEFEG
jgi:phosphomannomutase